MNAQELRELDAWLAFNVMGWKPFTDEYWANNWRPHEEADSAMRVLEKCLERKDIGDPFISKQGKGYWIRAVQRYKGGNIHVDGEGKSI